MNKRIFICYGEHEEEYGGGATAELSNEASGMIYAVISSPSIDELWEDLQRRMAAHAIKGSPASTIMADLYLSLRSNRKIPFVCFQKLNDSEWACTERCIVGSETAKEFMR